MGLFFPSYRNGFATRGESEAPGLWRRLEYAGVLPLGPSGLASLPDVGGRKHTGTFNDLEAADWEIDERGWHITPEGGSGQERWDCLTWGGGPTIADGVSVLTLMLDDTAGASMSTYHRIVSWYDGANNIQLGIGQGSSDERFFYGFVGGSTGAADVVQSVTATTGVHHLVYTTDGAAHALYVDGVSVSGGALVADVGVFTANDQLHCCWRGSTNATGIIGRMYLVLVWSRILTANEVRDLYLDPMRMFRPRRRVFAVPAAVGGVVDVGGNMRGGLLALSGGLQ